MSRGQEVQGMMVTQHRMSGHNTYTAAQCESVESVSRARVATHGHVTRKYPNKYHLWSPVMMPMVVAECALSRCCLLRSLST